MGPPCKAQQLQLVYLTTVGSLKTIANLAHQPTSTYKVPELLESITHLYGSTASSYLLNTNGASTAQQKPMAFLQHNLIKQTLPTQIVTTAGPSVYYLYGSSRLGEQKHYAGTSTGSIYHHQEGSLSYELIDHLGNVKLTTNNRLKLHYRNNSFHLEPTLLSSVDYYPFGMVMPGRNMNLGEYRYGFNGFEKDDELKGTNNHISFGDYGLDVRLARRWNIDPAKSISPDWNPYRVFFDNPIIYLDPNGKTEFLFLNIINEKTGEKLSVIAKISDKEIKTIVTKGSDNSRYERTYDIKHTQTITIKKDGTVEKSERKTENILVDEDMTGPGWIISQVYDGLMAVEDGGWFEGGGEVVKGGYKLTSKDANGKTSTKTVAKGSVEQRDIGDFLIVSGAVLSDIASLPNKTANAVVDIQGMFDKAIEIAEMKTTTSSSSGGQNGTVPDTLLCPAGCKIPMEQGYEKKLDGHAGQTVGYDTIPAAK